MSEPKSEVPQTISGNASSLTSCRMSSRQLRVGWGAQTAQREVPVVLSAGDASLWEAFQGKLGILWAVTVRKKGHYWYLRGGSHKY